nr:peptidoglycan DD-metalloendopeptidase family protein [uncultured Desulfuromonas sp.]
MEEKVHLIITGDNRDSRSVMMTEKRLRRLIRGGLAATVLFTVFTVVSVYTLVQDHSRQQRMTNLESQVQWLNDQNAHLRHQVNRQRTEKKELISNAVNHLNERSTQIESLLQKVGVEVVAEEGSIGAEGSGGPYIAAGAGNFDDALFYSSQLLELADQVPLGRPAEGYLSSSYGRRRDPFNGHMAFHSGIDIAHFVGTKVYATASGTVVSCGVVSGYGKMVKIKHNDRFSTLYGHLQKIYLKPGTKVARGDAIGTMGNTGRSTGPHLHYEIHDNDHTINPYSLTFLNR